MGGARDSRKAILVSGKALWMGLGTSNVVAGLGNPIYLVLGNWGRSARVPTQADDCLPGGLCTLGACASIGLLHHWRTTGMEVG